ncbi:MAG: phosphoenolpyruvate carboxykinase, partial [Deltaproteobacteria bacterium]
AAAQDLKTGTIRRDPFAMIPFCGYNMADYFGHWLRIGKQLKNPPKIFAVNWFRKDEEGRYLWPGFGENIRILRWIIDRVKGRVKAKETPIGLVPYPEDINTEGLQMGRRELEKALEVKPEEWRREASEIREFFSRFGQRMPEELLQELEKLEKALGG